jgi:conjugal transfer/type IV secretion protein DotA/TraY
MTISLTKTLKYAALPGITSRIRDLRLDFGYIAYLMALIFSIVRLLPPTHPYLMPANMGRFSVRQVLAAAAYNLKGGIKNVDQYIIYGGFLLGIVLLLMQFVILFATIVISSANAGGYLGDFGALFHTPYPASDVAFLLLDSVFQIPGFFNSAAGPAAAADITPFAQGMHYLFAFYSGGMLFIAGMIIVYYIFVVIVESAQTGVPFGERFDSVYVPIRLVLAIALLLPTYHGLNSGQYLTLLMAKWGSGFATNAWLIHNNTILNNPTGTGRNNPLGLTTGNLAVRPKIEEIGSLVTFFMLQQTCRWAYHYQYSAVDDDNQPKNIQPYFVRTATTTPGTSQMVSAQSYTDALNFYGNGTIKIVFGEHSSIAAYRKYPGNVKPYCGVLTFPVDAIQYASARDIYETYYDFIIGSLIADADISAYGQRTALIHFVEREQPNGACGVTVTRTWGSPCAMNSATPPRCECAQAASTYSNSLKNDFQALFTANMNATINTIRSTDSPQLAITEEMLALGWGGAGTWFNRIAEFNGAMVSSSLNKPAPSAMPAVMEHVAEQKLKNQNSGPFKDRYNPNLQEGGTTIEQYFEKSGLDVTAIDIGLAKLLDATYRRLDSADLTEDPGSNVERPSKNPIVNMINAIFGMTGLFDLRQNIDVHPMARLAALGRGIIDKSITYLGGALLLAGMGGLFGAADANFSKGFDTLSGALSGIGMTALTVGFVFYFIIPLMPFMYFFFACARWVKTIFEAMVGVPLWALAHLKIDGEGIPAQAASNGYFLLLEILIRPILTVFGLLLAFSAFAAMVIVLDTIFNIVVFNVGGSSNLDKNGNPMTQMLELTRSALDEFLFTAVYCIIVYLIATSCFKLIDLIPNGILRFAGAGVASFGDKAEDPMQSMTKYTAVAGHMMTNTVQEGIKGLGNAAGSVAGAAVFRGGGAGGGGKPSAASEMIERLKGPGPS